MALIEPKLPEPPAYSVVRDSDLEQITAQKDRARNESILDQIPAAEKIRRAEEKADREKAQRDAEKQALVAKEAQCDAELRNANIFKADLARAKYHHDEAQAAIRNIRENVKAWFFNGGHPQFGKDAPPLMALNAAATVAGAREIIAAYEEFVPEKQAQIEKAEQSAIALAKELGLVHLLPRELQTKANQQ